MVLDQQLVELLVLVLVVPLAVVRVELVAIAFVDVGSICGDCVDIVAKYDDVGVLCVFVVAIRDEGETSCVVVVSIRGEEDELVAKIP